MAESNKDVKKIMNFSNLNSLLPSKEIHEDLKNNFTYAIIKRAKKKEDVFLIQLPFNLLYIIIIL